jgi:hypothetical protein
VNRKKTIAVAISGLSAGLLINLFEWAAHHWWLDAQWTAAFAAIGRTPKGWDAFIPANFWLGILLVWGYTWFTRHYPSRTGALVRAAVAGWIMFWVIPTLALAPMEIFPNRLLALVVAVGAVDGTVAVVLGAWIYDRLAPTSTP